MTDAGWASGDLPAGVRLVRAADDLDAFRDPACAAALWMRPVPQDKLDWLEALAPHMLPNGRLEVPVAQVQQAAAQLCDAAGLPHGDNRDWLLADIASLAQSFASMMRVSRVHLRVQAITTNACRKFHLDALKGRLVCTYRGAGTQLGTSVAQAEPENIVTVPTGTPVLLRGTLWPPQPQAGLLHRSPPIEGTGVTRLILVVDPVSSAADPAE